MAYVAEEDDQQFVVMDGGEGKRYGSIFNLTFSPDGQHLSYMASHGTWDEHKPDFIVTDGEDSKYPLVPYVDAEATFAFFSFTPDSNHVIYFTLKWNAEEKTIKEHLVIDNKLSEPFDEVYHGPLITLDSQSVAYAVRIGNEIWWKVDSIDEILKGNE